MRHPIISKEKFIWGGSGRGAPFLLKSTMAFMYSRPYHCWPKIDLINLQLWLDAFWYVQKESTEQKFNKLILCEDICIWKYEQRILRVTNKNHCMMMFDRVYALYLMHQKTWFKLSNVWLQSVRKHFPQGFFCRGQFFAL